MHYFEKLLMNIFYFVSVIFCALLCVICLDPRLDKNYTDSELENIYEKNKPCETDHEVQLYVGLHRHGEREIVKGD